MLTLVYTILLSILALLFSWSSCIYHEIIRSVITSFIFIYISNLFIDSNFVKNIMTMVAFREAVVYKPTSTDPNFKTPPLKTLKYLNNIRLLSELNVISNINSASYRDLRLLVKYILKNDIHTYFNQIDNVYIHKKGMQILNIQVEGNTHDMSMILDFNKYNLTLFKVKSIPVVIKIFLISFITLSPFIKDRFV